MSGHHGEYRTEYHPDVGYIVYIPMTASERAEYGRVRQLRGDQL
jgi:hypothetical protein